ncbi:hypothetical protein TWF506_009663 [Arthrobotrys conoides]|uniref:DUF4215 domain-containing protein n=1 Tax=Arthrobotrys conoides TaxID=74498 RepID=A0AAN8NIT2_9PEZI
MKAISLLPFLTVAFAEDLLFHSSFTGYEDLVAADRNGRFSFNWTYSTVSTREWQAMTTNDFKKFKAIVIGDPISTDPDRLEPLMENRQTWGNAIEGNVILIGTDTSNHYSDAQTLMSNGIAFAATGKGTGLYFSLSKYYGAKNKTTVPILDIFGNFEVRGDLNAEEQENCYDEVHIVARNQVLDGITDQVLSNWSCSVHEAFVTFPSSGTESFVPLAIAQDVPGEGSRDFSDGTSGIPYILVRGASPIGCGNGKLDPGEECDDGNTNDGDGCNSACRFEAGFKKQASGGKIAGGVIGAIAGVAALGGLGFLAVTKTVWGAKAGAAIGIGTSSAAGGGGGGGAGAAGASGAMYVPTGVEGKAAAAVSGYVPTGIEGKAAAQAGYVPGVAEKTANAVAHGTGQAVNGAAQGAAQAGQGLSSMAVPPPTDAGATAASTAFAPPVDPTSAAGAATTTAPVIPPGYVPGSEGLAASTAGPATGGAAGGTAVGSSAAGGLAPGVASAAGPTGGLAPGLAGGAATGTTVGTGGGLTTAQTVGTSLAAGLAGFGAALFGRKKKNKENAPLPPDTENTPIPPVAPPVGQQQYYNYSPQQQYYDYSSQQQQPYYPQQPQQQYYPQQEHIVYAPQPVPQPLGAFDEKEIKSGEPSSNANLNIGVQEVVPTPSHEVQADPISRPSEMPISEQPYIPPPPPTAAQRKEYDYN